MGPRLAGRLTAELILRSPQYMNCVKEYEIDLRGLLFIASSLRVSQCRFGFALNISALPVVLSGKGSSMSHVAYAGSKINSIENLGATQVRTLTLSSQSYCDAPLHTLTIPSAGSKLRCCFIAEPI